MSGLEPVGGVTVVVATEDLLRGDPAAWPDEPFAIEGPILCTSLDVY